MSYSNQGGPSGPPSGPGSPPPLNQPGAPGYPPGYHPGYPPGSGPPQPYYGGEGARPIVIGDRTYILAPYLDRVLAWFIDQLILGAPAMVFGISFQVLIMALIASSRGEPNPALIIIMVLLLLTAMAVVFGFTIWYWCFFITREMWSTGPGQTLGCKVMKIKVIKQDGSEIRPTDGLLRFLGLLVSYLVFYLGFLWIVIDDRNLGWHDSIAGTYVVKV